MAMRRQIILKVKLFIRRIGRKLGFGWQKMWERYTICARKAIFFAEDEARRLNHSWITPEHFLLGLIHQEDNTASNILRQIGIDLADLRQVLLLKMPIFHTEYDFRQVSEMHLTSRGKQVLELACTQAEELGNNYIGTEHLLLGILQEGGLAAHILNELGVNIKIIINLLKLKIYECQ